MFTCVSTCYHTKHVLRASMWKWVSSIYYNFFHNFFLYIAIFFFFQNNNFYRSAGQEILQDLKYIQSSAHRPWVTPLLKPYSWPKFEGSRFNPQTTSSVVCLRNPPTNDGWLKLLNTNLIKQQEQQRALMSTQFFYFSLFELCTVDYSIQKWVQMYSNNSK